jgi:CDP-diacylglycerol pyrophosphatase
MRQSLTRPLRLGLFALLSVLASAETQAGERGLLWRVVQACVLNHTLTGRAFPCLAVEPGSGDGYAVLRAPTEDVHVIVTPTVRTIGLEAPQLRGDDAPNYFHDAWDARHFVTDTLARQPNRTDLALAVNSRPGRSQDQLHIHIACIREDVRQTLLRRLPAIQKNDWMRLAVSPAFPAYWAHYESSPDLAGVNVFDRVASGLHIDESHMAETTIVVVGSAPTGFVILARQRQPHTLDEAHGEYLLDHDCSAFRSS